MLLRLACSGPAEDPLLRAAEMFSNPASGSGSNKPAAPSGAAVAHLQKTTAPKTPPKHPAPKALRSLLLQLRSFQLTMSRCFKQPNAAAMNSCDQISQRAKGHNAVEFYEEGMTPLLSYMFFVLHYHENL